MFLYNGSWGSGAGSSVANWLKVSFIFEELQIDLHQIVRDDQASGQ